VSSVSVLRWVLVHRTPFGTRIEWHRGSGLLARDAAGRSRPLTPDEARRQFPAAWPAWLQLAGLLPPGDAGSRHAGPAGGTAA
jgi:hypothetical protein